MKFIVVELQPSVSTMTIVYHLLRPLETSGTFWLLFLAIEKQVTRIKDGNFGTYSNSTTK